MPDISMCYNKQCPSKELCYRYRAIPNWEWQSYSLFEVEEGENKCNFFESIRDGDRIRDIKDIEK